MPALTRAWWSRMTIRIGSLIKEGILLGSTPPKNLQLQIYQYRVIFAHIISSNVQPNWDKEGYFTDGSILYKMILHLSIIRFNVSEITVFDVITVACKTGYFSCQAIISG
jgi:hypothetical protein